MVQLTNSTSQTLTQLAVSWDYEKYRDGTRDHQATFSHGSDGSTWTTEMQGSQLFSGGTGFEGISPPSSTHATATVTGLSIPQGGSYYLRWTFAAIGLSSNSPAVGIDNFSVTGSIASVPEESALVLTGAAAAIAVIGRRFLNRKASAA